MIKQNVKQFILWTIGFFAFFTFILPVVFLLISEIHEPGVLVGTFCVNNYSQILHGILTKPEHFLNIWFMYFTATGYCGTPFYYHMTFFDEIFFFLQMLAAPFLVSTLMAYLLVKALQKNNTKLKLYLTCFIAIIIFLIIRYVKNGISNPLLLEFGADPLVNFTPHYSYPVAVWQAFLYGPSGIMDRTDPQVYTSALLTSFVLDALVSLLGGYILTVAIVFLVRKKKVS